MLIFVFHEIQISLVVLQVFIACTLRNVTLGQYDVKETMMELHKFSCMARAIEPWGMPCSGLYGEVPCRRGAFSMLCSTLLKGREINCFGLLKGCQR